MRALTAARHGLKAIREAVGIALAAEAQLQQAEALAAQVVVHTGPRLFYVQDARTYVGNSMMWWADGGGYTSDPSKAQVWTEADLRTLPGRHTDIAWPKAYIDARWRHHVDAQTCSKAEAGVIQPPKPPPLPQPRHTSRCYGCGRFCREEPNAYCEQCDDPGWDTP